MVVSVRQFFRGSNDSNSAFLVRLQFLQQFLVRLQFSKSTAITCNIQIYALCIVFMQYMKNARGGVGSKAFVEEGQ